ncbi:MAG TPA: hypothetical protein VLC48_03175, partial [Gemmatimonadota bacterium]|nr:hypothetical protein [Gemmatimonadota bacterium]
FDRFATLVSDKETKGDPDSLKKVEEAFDILKSVSAGGSDAFYLKLKPGARLRDAVAARFAATGRAFAAARVAGLATLGALNGKADDMLQPLSFDGWNTGERQLAPPLVIELEGADLHAGDLADFLDGSVKIVLLVNGEAPPAPLVRLITPSTFVMQTSEEAELEKFAAAAAPAIAALMPAAAARFVHDPAAGERLQDRLKVSQTPEKPPRKKLGGMSALQQKGELDQLQALAASREAELPVEDAAAPAVTMTSVDKLASWLLSNTDLSGS